ncbi:protoporphyrinogen oxidase [Segniliparus rotundus DSM 44985]|uniref:Coproporphyrinogen III oxidase n=1 Tax=Segniliparus rotundus (strain ATCC BAA-972 / CDC 1076 / CIP 108378 / DSM 44985 / JCM 13578) TaxID=640132 RepID=D6Z8U6_SEGRD|nr:protoporphyrinogen oxidase [Segniliparus rotundus]ADG98376.1 protoporphyrinogen oxidase [Segniliparus rotundus DSM 44985]
MTAIAVVGAGVTGLVAAYELRKRFGSDAKIVVIDGSERAGGCLRGVELAGQPLDGGAESFLANASDMFRLADELGLSDQIVSSSGARPSVFAAGSRHPLPTGTYFGLPGPDVDTTLLRADDLDLIRQDRPTDWEVGADMSIGELVEPVHGANVRSRLVDPLLSGIYAGDSWTIGVRSGLPQLAARLDEQAAAEAQQVSLNRAVEAARSGMGTAQGPMFRSFRGGLQVFVQALQSAIGTENLLLGQPVNAIAPEGSGFQVEPFGGFDAVVLAVGAPALSGLLAGVDDSAAEAAASITTASPVVVAVRSEPFGDCDGVSGVLVASGEGLGAKALTISGNKWAHLGAPVLRASFGRCGEDLSHVPDEQLLAWAASDFTRLFHKRLSPLDWVVERYPQALPQYAPQHGRKVAAISAASSGRLAIAGNFLRGVGLGACAATAVSAAEQVANVLEK